MEEHHSGEDKQSRSRPVRVKGVPGSSTLNQLFESDKAIWLKMGGAALVLTCLALMMVMRVAEEQDPDYASPVILVVVGLLAAITGALLGLALSLKDVVASRLQAGQKVAFPLRLMFGMGVVSLLLVWVPLVIVMTLLITILLLS